MVTEKQVTFDLAKIKNGVEKEKAAALKKNNKLENTNEAIPSFVKFTRLAKPALSRNKNKQGYWAFKLVCYDHDHSSQGFVLWLNDCKIHAEVNNIYFKYIKNFSKEK